MTDALSIGWTAGQAATQRTVYRRVLGFALIVQTVLALIAIVAPIWLARAAELPGAPSAGWVRLWGLMLLITAALYLPGWIEPVGSASLTADAGQSPSGLASLGMGNFGVACITGAWPKIKLHDGGAFTVGG